MELPPITAIKAHAPPGGCTVFVKFIVINAKATATAAVNQFPIPIVCSSHLTKTPIRDDSRYPPTTFRGCANGL